MATNSSTAENARSSAEPGTLALVCVVAWAVPGASHLWLGRRQKGFVFLVVLSAMFAIGLLLVCVAATCMGMLNARGHFFIPAMGATMLNVVMIASVLWLAPKFGDELHEQIYGLAYGVLIAGFAQATFQLPTL